MARDMMVIDREIDQDGMSESSALIARYRALTSSNSSDSLGQERKRLRIRCVFTYARLFVVCPSWSWSL